MTICSLSYLIITNALWSFDAIDVVASSGFQKYRLIPLKKKNNNNCIQLRMKVYSLSHFYESAVISVSNNPDLITRIVIVCVSFFLPEQLCLARLCWLFTISDLDYCAGFGSDLVYSVPSRERISLTIRSFQYIANNIKPK